MEKFSILMTMLMTMTLKSMCEPGLVVIKIMIMTPCEPGSSLNRHYSLVMQIAQFAILREFFLCVKV